MSRLEKEYEAFREAVRRERKRKEAERRILIRELCESVKDLQSFAKSVIS